MGREQKVEVRRAADRFVTEADGILSRHSFSFGAHYDPTNVGLALLVAHNDDLVRPGAGYGTHPHRDMEIVTWVLEGRLEHRDSTGHAGVLYPGLAQRLSAGSGVEHSERNAEPSTVAGRSDIDDSQTEGSDAVPDEHTLRFVQMWVLPDEPGLAPSYAQHDVTEDLAGGGWVTIASGTSQHLEQAAIPINNSHASLHVARLGPGRTVELPDAPYLHAFVATGTADLEDAGALEPGDAVRLTAAGGRRVTATRPGTELLVWEMWPEPLPR